MPAVVPFIPLISQGIGLGVGALAGKKVQQGAMQRSPEEQAAMMGAQGVAGQSAQTAGSLLKSSQGLIGGPANYFSTLLSGSRGAMNQAVAPGMKAATDVYRGAERNLSHAGIQGARRDTQLGELNRSRASDIAGMVTGVQPAAAGALANLGTTVMGHAAPLLSTAGNIYSTLLNSGYENRKYARGEGANTTRAIGGLVATAGNVLGGMFGNKPPGGGGGATPPWLPQTESLPAPMQWKYGGRI